MEGLESSREANAGIGAGCLTGAASKTENRKSNNGGGAGERPIEARFGKVVGSGSAGHQ